MLNKSHNQKKIWKLELGQVKKNATKFGLLRKNLEFGSHLLKVS